jgi:hypothetical protein
MDIIEIIQKKVDKLTKQNYAGDECPPQFIVSLFYNNREEDVDSDSDHEHKIIMTVLHSGYAFSKVIFPITKYIYGYESLEDEMKYMYNRTM